MKNRAFTLVEILIVVMILSILAMTVTPFMVEASHDSRETALLTDLATLRRMIEIYKAEHGGRGPHLDADNELHLVCFKLRLTGRTDPDGTVNPAGTCGPYLSAWPRNQFVSDDVADAVVFGTGTPPTNGSAGWFFNTGTGDIDPGFDEDKALAPKPEVELVKTFKDAWAGRNLSDGSTAP